MDLTRPLVVLDTETTGVDPDIDRIVQIAIIRQTPRPDNEPGPGRWCYLVDPGEPIPPEASAVHGITDADVNGERDFASVWSLLSMMVLGADICAYNGQFDFAMIDAELRRAEKPPWDRSGVRILDPLVIFRRFRPHTLAGAMAYYRSDAEFADRAHDALADCEATLDVLTAQVIMHDLASMDALAEASTPPPDDRWCDPDRKFYWRFCEPWCAFGKHRGKSLREILRCDRQYLDWVLSPRGMDLRPETRHLLEQALDGSVPTNAPAQLIEPEEPLPF